VGLSNDVVSGPCGPLVRVWAAKCGTPTDFSSIASVHPGIGFVRVGGATTVHLRGPQTRATTLSCPRDAEYFGADFRLGAYLPMFRPARLANLQDAMLPVLPDGRILLDGRAWEMPAPQNLDVLVMFMGALVLTLRSREPFRLAEPGVGAAVLEVRGDGMPWYNPQHSPGKL
jgi:hypothetical protein